MYISSCYRNLTVALVHTWCTFLWVAKSDCDLVWPLNLPSRRSDKVHLIVLRHEGAHKYIIHILLLSTVRSSFLMLIGAVSSLLTPRSPLWQFSKSNANPVVGLCKKASHNIDCHSQLREWGKGLVFTSNLRLAQPAPKTQLAQSDQWV